VEYPAPDTQKAWLALRGAVLSIPVMLRVALRQPHDRAEAIRVARVTRQLYADAVAELGDFEGNELVGATLEYVRGRVVDVFGQDAWDEASPAA
jgi:hypothetical protein